METNNDDLVDLVTFLTMFCLNMDGSETLPKFQWLPQGKLTQMWNINHLYPILLLLSMGFPHLFLYISMYTR
jgi:hypothetical protein